MKDYVQAIERGEEFGLATGTRIINDGNIVIFPFKNIDASKPHANLNWWKDYQSIKHDRIKNVTKGNLANAVSSVAAQYIILRQLIEFVAPSEGKDYLKRNYRSQYWIPVV